MVRNSVLKAVIIFQIVLLLLPMISSPVFSALDQKYENEDDDYSIYPPRGWTLSEETNAVYFYGSYIPRTGGYVTMNIIVEPMSGSVTNLDPSEMFQTITQTLPNTDLISDQMRHVGGMDCLELVYTYSATYGYELFVAKIKQVFFIEDGKGYVITFTTMQETYDVDILAFEESLATFEVTSPVQYIPAGSRSSAILIALIMVVAFAVFVYIIYKRTQGRPKPVTRSAYNYAHTTQWTPQRAVQTITTQESIKIRCQRCRTLNSEISNFCTECGSRL
jgi:hypothetical protein